MGRKASYSLSELATICRRTALRLRITVCRSAVVFYNTNKRIADTRIEVIYQSYKSLLATSVRFTLLIRSFLPRNALIY